MTEFDAENFDVEAILQAVNELKSEYNEKQNKVSELKTQYDEIERTLKAVWRERQELIREQEARRNDIRLKEKELDRQRRLQEAQEKRKKILEAFEEAGAKLDDLTASAKWREFAFDHQIEGGKRLAVAKRGILADKRGLGKTLTSLIWLDMVQAKRVIVIAPNDIVPQFEEEIREWAPNRTILSLRGMTPGERTAFYPVMQFAKEFIVTLNYEAWRKDKTIVDDLVAAGFDSIICDEAHKIKSSSKITARGVFQITYRPNYCAACDKHENFCGPWVTGKGLPKDVNYRFHNEKCPTCSGPLTSTVKNVLTMTGTPMLNKPQELFSLLYMVDCERFYSEKNFLRDYCYQAGPNRWRFLSGGLDRLTKSMSEFFVQRNREDAGIHIPPPAVRIYRIDKDKSKYAKQYEAEYNLKHNAALVLENGDVQSMLYILEIILRERQCMTWPAGIVLKDPETKEIICNFDVQESQKLDEAASLLQDLIEEDERVIVFSKFKAPLYEMRKRFPDEPMVVATGDQSTHLRTQVVRDFDLKTAPETPRWKVAFATYDAFATGLNLNAARHVIMLDDEWSPGMEDQAIGRIDRLNSTDQANVHIFRVNKSIDDFMESLLEEKRQLTEGFESTLSAADLLTHLRSAG